jgi:hypothetical protein
LCDYKQNLAKPAAVISDNAGAFVLCVLSWQSRNESISSESQPQFLVAKMPPGKPMQVSPAECLLDE